MTAIRPFQTSRESVLPIWSNEAQSRRSIPDARAPELFVFLHGILFNNIQLDNFQPTLARIIERLEIEGAEECEWIMMAIINISSILEYGNPHSLLRKKGYMVSGPHLGGVDEEKMDSDDNPKGNSPIQAQLTPSAKSRQEEQPATLKFALELTFAMLSHVLHNHSCRASQYAESNPNPYLTVILTFLSTIIKHRPALDILESSLPWDELASFLSLIPSKIMYSLGLNDPSEKRDSHRNIKRWVMLTSGCPHPLPEDWCMRGMAWTWREVYERGFWKSGKDQKAELEVLEMREGVELASDDNPSRSSSSTAGYPVMRWVRIVRCGVDIAGIVEGFNRIDGTRKWTVEGKLAEKLARWKKDEQIEQVEEERQ